MDKKDKLILEEIQNRKITREPYEELFNRLFGIELSETEARKELRGIENYLSHKQEFGDGEVEENLDVVDKEFEFKLRELQKERVKLRTEKLAVNEQIRKEARKEMIYEDIREYIKELKPIQVPVFEAISTGNKKAICGFADVHFGKDIVIEDLFGNPMNVYNEEVFEARMWKLFESYVNKKEKFGLTKVVVIDGGDSIEGILRLSSLQVIKYGIVESVIKYSNFISTWLNELSKHFEIEFYNCLGNHSEFRPLGSKSGEFPKENAEYLIREMIQLSLKDNKRITISPTRKLQYIDVDGYKILATHGQEERNLVSSVKEYKEMFDVKIDLMLTGHLHNSKQDTASLHTKVIQLPSIVGIDDYSMMLKKTARPEGKMIIIDGRDSYFIDIDLS